MDVDEIIAAVGDQGLGKVNKVGVVGDHTVVMIKHIHRRHLDAVDRNPFIQLLNRRTIVIQGSKQIDLERFAIGDNATQLGQQVGHMFTDPTDHMGRVFPTNRKHTHDGLSF